MTKNTTKTAAIAAGTMEERPWGAQGGRYYLVRSDGPRSNGPQGTGPFLRLFPASSHPFPFSLASARLPVLRAVCVIGRI